MLKRRFIQSSAVKTRSRATPEANHSRANCYAHHAVGAPWIALVLVTLIPALPIAAQQDSVSALHQVDGPSIKWWHGAVALGGISALMLLDEPAQRFAQRNRGTGSDNVANVVRHFGQPDVYGTVTLGLAAVGLATHNPRLTGAAKRIGASLLFTGLATEGAKETLGRPRPNQSLDADGYDPFSGQVSMPSGHTSMAFALATSLSDEIHRPWATVGLYGMATAVGWSRINDNRHWLSDVATGALIGITSSKLITGRWRIFGVRPPSMFLGPGRMAIGWQGSF
jgi:membrane-associated phospholipid phosphatase